MLPLLMVCSQWEQVMLSLLMDIKNNRVRGGGSSNVVLTAGTTKWLKAAGAPAVTLHGLTWEKLLAPNKKVMPAVISGWQLVSFWNVNPEGGHAVQSVSPFARCPAHGSSLMETI